MKTLHLIISARETVVLIILAQPEYFYLPELFTEQILGQTEKFPRQLATVRSTPANNTPSHFVTSLIAVMFFPARIENGNPLPLFFLR
jgi:hypothetical protein